MDGGLQLRSFHAHVLERLYTQVWHERTVAGTLMLVRTDRGELHWGAVRDISSQKRRRLEGPVHARSGPYLDFDNIFSMVWGCDWRNHLLSCPDYTTWKQGRRGFVEKCCLLHGLPAPYPGTPSMGLQVDAGRMDAEKDTIPREMTLPKTLFKHSMWLTTGPTKLEFIVDNETLAGLANLELAVSNPVHYRQVCNIRSGLKGLFSGGFRGKSGLHESRRMASA